ncbi:MAG: DUF805 domain-containing protein [Pseudomonadota bacterium]|nr:DUF805 domain-containing protein [Pseudomonadota bacterium]
MDWKNLYLSMEGRTNRQPFWLGIVVLVIVTWILEFILFTAFGVSLIPSMDPNADPAAAAAAASAMMGKMAVPLIILALLILWPNLCLYAKRWHDRDKSGWWTLIMFVPLIGSIWLLVELGFLRGTPGPNRFGPDPLA